MLRISDRGISGSETVVKCKVEIKTGVRDTSDVTRNNVSAVTETIMGKKETTIDKTLTVTDEVEWSLGFELNLDVKIPIMTALNADINGKIRYDYTDTKRKTVTDKVKVSSLCIAYADVNCLRSRVHK